MNFPPCLSQKIPGLHCAAKLGVTTVAAVTLAACASLFPTQYDLKLTVVSSPQAQWVSGDSALVKIMGDVQPIGRLRVTLNGRDVTSSFARQTDGKLTALLDGLQLGKNLLVADLQLPGDTFMAATGTLEITNHPRSGPMFSGPQQQPFACQTDTFLLPASKATLGAPLDGNCSIATRVDYVYRNTAAKPDFVPLPSLKNLPADVASTTTLDGKTLPYIVRVETGTLNRAIYQTAVLHNPSADEASSHRTPPKGWNGRLVYTFGGGCTGGWYRQGNITGGVLDHNILKQGYAMASSSLNVFGVNCQDLTAAESMAMVKEQFIKTIGLPRYTIGWGCSGGSYQQHQIADNYPGLLDGILPGCSFPEVGFATVQSITDQRLLGNYFKNKVPGIYSDEQQRQIAGVHSAKVIYATTVYEGSMRIAPDVFCPATLPAEQRYNAATHPKGVRCSIYDHNINVYGKDPVTGFARRPIDNVGVQYGLRALNEGVITVDQFLDINAAAGGYDLDGKFSLARTVGDAQAMRASYQTGRLTSGGGGLKDIPIVDYRAYSDDNPVGDIHLRYHSFSMRERLIKANGNADNQVMLVEDFRYGYYSSDSPLLMSALSDLDKWLAGMAADTKPGSQRDKVIRNKPASLQEGCLTRDAVPTKIAEKFDRTSGQCAGIYPAPASPRFVAGGPITADVIKCQLRPVNQTDYTKAFTPEQQARLATVFPQGVCDWSRPGVEQQGLRGIWLSF